MDVFIPEDFSWSRLRFFLRYGPPVWEGISQIPACYELIAQNWIREVQKKLDFIKYNSRILFTYVLDQHT